MHSVKLSRLIVSLALLLLLGGIGVMGADAFKPAPVTVEAPSGVEHSILSIGTLSDTGTTFKQAGALIDGKYERLFSTGEYRDTSILVTKTMARFPLWHRPPIKRFRQYLALNGQTLFYDLGAAKSSSEKANLYFRYVLVSNTENTFESRKVTLDFDAPFAWVHDAMFQVQGDKLAVLVPTTPSMAEGKEVTLAFVISLTDGTVLEQRVLDDKSGLGSDYSLVSRQSNTNYSPEVLLASKETHKFDTPQASTDDDSYTFALYDYFTDKLTPIQFQSPATNVVSSFITGSTVHLIERTPEEAKPGFAQMDPNEWQDVADRKAVPAKLYEVTANGSTRNAMDLSLDPVSLYAMTLADDRLVYMGFANQQSLLTVVNLKDHTMMGQSPVTYRDGVKVRFENDVVMY